MVDMGESSAPAQVVLCYGKQLDDSLESRAGSNTPPTPLWSLLQALPQVLALTSFGSDL